MKKKNSTGELWKFKERRIKNLNNKFNISPYNKDKRMISGANEMSHYPNDVRILLFSSIIICMSSDNV